MFDRLHAVVAVASPSCVPTCALERLLDDEGTWGDAAEWLPALPEASVDLFFTSPHEGRFRVRLLLREEPRAVLQPGRRTCPVQDSGERDCAPPTRQEWPPGDRCGLWTEPGTNL